MKKIIFSFSLLLLANILFAQKLVIVHTNDMHQKIVGFGPESSYTPEVINNDSTLGGFARLATVIKEEKQAHPDNLLVLDAGDFLMGTLFQVLEPSTGFELNLMKQVGFDVTTFGNHEFDFGANALADVVTSAQKRGGTPTIVAPFLKFSDKKGDDKLQALYGTAIKPYIVLKRNGLKIGIFSVLGDDAIADVKFAAPLQFEDKFKIAKQYTKLLRDKEKVDIVICLSHTGVVPDGKGGFVGEDIDLAKKVKDIDIIISAHTHVVTPHYLKVGKTIIVQTGCYLHNVGELQIDYKNKQVSVTSFKLIPLDDKILGDKNITNQINDFKKVINKEVLAKYNLTYNTKIAETNFEIPMSTAANTNPSALGNLITDAMRYYINNFSTEKTDITLEGNGLIREEIMKGIITTPDVFRVVALGFGEHDYEGYPLIKAYFYPHEIKQLLELAVSMLPPGTDKFLYFSGVKAFYDPKGGFLNKIKKLEIDGKEVDISRKNKTLYSLSTDSYVYSFMGYIKKASHGLVKLVPKDKNGNPITEPKKYYIDFNADKPGIQEGKLWIALIKYFETFPDTNNDGIPDIPDKYKSFEPFASVINK